MTLPERVKALAALGSEMSRLFLEVQKGSFTDPWTHEFNSLLEKIPFENPWFTFDNMVYAWEEIAGSLSEQALLEWISPYAEEIHARKRPASIAVVMAGNIPMAGFHDFLCTLITGNILKAKLSASDNRLIPFMGKVLVNIHPAFSEMIFFSDGPLADFDKVIASGSNNTARYFEYYFRNVPHIIRKHRNGVSILDGKESSRELDGLMDDIFRYFGLGCRSVSKLFVPVDYSWKELFQASLRFQHLSQHHKYRNNYDYQKAIRIMNNQPFLDNGFTLLQPSSAIASPIGVIFYETYDSPERAVAICEQRSDEIQCVVSHVFPGSIAFGESQKPSLGIFADQIDTIRFLTEP